MNPKLRLALQLLAVALVAAITCWLTGWLLPERRGHDVVGSHYSIHHALDLTEEQERALVGVEERYEVRWKELAIEIQQANVELAASLRRDQAWSSGVAASVERITRAQGDLQKATLEHVFAMKPHLTPEQYERLLDLCAESLERSPESPRGH